MSSFFFVFRGTKKAPPVFPSSAEAYTSSVGFYRRI
jgi:hypothetical protein